MVSAFPTARGARPEEAIGHYTYILVFASDRSLLIYRTLCRLYHVDTADSYRLDTEPLESAPPAVASTGRWFLYFAPRME
jgi:hypothetical protein